MKETIQKAKWTRAQINDLPDSSFAYVEAGGKKDKSGKTVPRSLRHYPYKGSSGAVDLPHLRNALARVGQHKKFWRQAAPKLLRVAKAAGVGRGKKGK